MRFFHGSNDQIQVGSIPDASVAMLGENRFELRGVPDLCLFGATEQDVWGGAMRNLIRIDAAEQSKSGR